MLKCQMLKWPVTIESLVTSYVTFLVKKTRLCTFVVLRRRPIFLQKRPDFSIFLVLIWQDMAKGDWPRFLGWTGLRPGPRGRGRPGAIGRVPGISWRPRSVDGGRVGQSVTRSPPPLLVFKSFPIFGESEPAESDAIALSESGRCVGPGRRSCSRPARRC